MGTITHKKCSKCGEIKELSAFSTKMCWCNTCNARRVRNTPLPLKMYRAAKTRAKRAGLPFNIEVSDIIIPEKCPIFDEPLDFSRKVGFPRDFSPSLDRIIPELGYTKGNIQVISYLANKMKSNASPKKLLLFAKWINNNTKKLKLEEN